MRGLALGPLPPLSEPAGHAVGPTSPLWPAAASAARRETRFGPNTRLVYCSACDLWRPRSAEHCEDCDVCCVGYDHHCPWTGKCIAAGNVCYFYVFLASVVVIMVFSMFVGLGTPLPRTRK